MLPSRVDVRPPATPFARILCAVDGSLGSREAAHQAIRLARGNTFASLCFVAARHDLGRDASLPSDLTEMQARNALEIGLAAAHHAGLDAEVSLLRGRPVADLLLEAAARFDLLALGATRRPATSAVRLGATATRLTQAASCSVLLARPGASRETGSVIELAGDADRLEDRIRGGLRTDSGSLLVCRRQVAHTQRGEEYLQGVGEAVRA
jgi:nucleotide-binding universal stress UspA family protein